MVKTKEVEFYGIKFIVEDLPLGFHVPKNPDDFDEGLAYAEKDVSYYEWISRQVPKDDFIQTLKSVIVAVKHQIEGDIIHIVEVMDGSPEKNREHKLEALHNTEKVLNKILEVLSKK